MSASPPKAFSSADRKAELVRLGVLNSEIAEECEVDRPLVTYILNGERLNAAQAERVMVYVAGLLKLPISVVFPETKAKGMT